MRKWDRREFEQVDNSKAWFTVEGRLDKDVLLEPTEVGQLRAYRKIRDSRLMLTA